MAFRIGGSVGRWWEKNKGAVAGLAGAGLGFALGGPAGAAAGYGIGSSVGGGNRAGAAPGTAGNTAEMEDLRRRRAAGLDSLERDAQHPYQAPLENDPMTGVQYDAPTSRPRDTSLFDKATNMTRPDGTIQNDAIDELRGMGQFQYRDRGPANMFNDNLEAIKGFQGEAGSLAKQFALNGAGSGGSVGARSVGAMTERANVDELMKFDPSASFEKYVTGAQGAFDETLKTANDRLTDTAAGGNRLKTGFFDLDRGELGRQLSADARNAMQMKALETNQQKLDAITSGTGIRANDLNSLREQYLAAETGNADRALRADTGNADRDSDFRLKSLGLLSDNDALRLKAMTTGRDFMVQDRDREDKIFNDDRESARTDFERWQDTLGKVGATQRADRSRNDDIFESDRDFNLDADTRRQGYYNDDEDRRLAAWQAGNDTRFRGGAVARGDREFTQGVHDNATNRYLDFLSGSSDRAQGAANAAATTAANRANSRNDLWGTILGTGGGLLADYLGRPRATVNDRIRTRTTTNDPNAPRAV